MQNKLTTQETAMLAKPVTGQELKEAMWSINPKKATGPNRFTADFFQKNWEIVGNDVQDTVIDFFSIGKLLKALDMTTITLIPIINVPSNHEGLQAHLLLYIVYKCISKIKVERMKS